MNNLNGKTRQIAGFSLILMAAGFIFVFVMEQRIFPDNIGLNLLISGFEAGLVGGLADWFAVTALFRHPFSLPIPHTAILPNSRERITTALVTMVENDLLNKKSIQEKIQTFPIAQSVLPAFKNHLQSISMKTMLRQITDALVNHLQKSTTLHFFQNLLSDFVMHIDIEPFIKIISEEVLTQRMETAALDFVLQASEKGLQQEGFHIKMGQIATDAVKNMPAKGFVKRSIPTVIGLLGVQKTGLLIQDFLLSLVQDMKLDANPSRLSLLQTLHAFIVKMPENKTLLQNWNVNRLQFMMGSDWDRTLKKSTQSVQQTAVQWLQNPDTLQLKLIPFFDNLLKQTIEDRALLQKLDDFLHEQLMIFVDAHHDDIGRLVKENIDRFDTKMLVQKIEDNVGNDIQWIRINGAICGFLVGVGLFGLKLFLRILSSQ